MAGCRKIMSQSERFLGRLGEMAAREGDRLTWVLGIDMAHMGSALRRRFGGCRRAEGEMQEVARRDHSRIERVLASDARGLLGTACRSARTTSSGAGVRRSILSCEPFPEQREHCADYEQWNIDEQQRRVVRRDVLYR